MSNTVKFSKAVENTAGDLVRTTKCNRFRVTRREYQIPFASVTYRVELMDGETVLDTDNDCESLSEAREVIAETLATPSDYYNAGTKAFELVSR